MRIKDFFTKSSTNERIAKLERQLFPKKEKADCDSRSHWMDMFYLAPISFAWKENTVISRLESVERKVDLLIQYLDVEEKTTKIDKTVLKKRSKKK